MNKDELIKRFTDYVNNYDMNNDKIALKYYHSIRVMELSIMIAKQLNLTKEQTNIVMIIGLIHDIGRFEQLKIYNSFSDLKTIDHANYSIKLLENGYLRNFNENNDYDHFILTAIKNHNKYQIEENLDDETQMFCKIIRDADKLDILKINENKKYELIDEITSNILKSFLSKNSCDKKHSNNKTDIFISNMALIFDLNYVVSYNYVYENNIIDKLCSNITYKNNQLEKTINDLIKYLKDYVYNKINE